jgi:ELWxxDGT repeat protein
MGNFAGREPTAPTTFQGAVYFFTLGLQGRRALWRSDGTGLGTKVLREFQPEPSGAGTPPPQELVVVGGYLFFRADDGVHGRELWRTDGTPQGTAMVRDLFPGATGSFPTWLRPGGDRLFFSAHDGVHGYELWQSDGTAAGTRLVQDIAPGSGSSYPEEITAAGGRLYFSADDGYTGRELWTLPLAASAACQPAPDQLCLGNGRFRVEARWRDFQGGTGRGTAVALTNETGYFWFFAPDNVEVVVKVLDGQGSTC